MYIFSLYLITLTLTFTHSLLCSERVPGVAEAELGYADERSEDTNKNEPTKNTVTITNAIEPKTLDYKYWGTHTPESFIVHINEKEIKQGESCEIPKEDKELKVTYSYSFASG